MTWFKISDGFAFHPKRLAAGNEAVGAWVVAGSWSSANLTDGYLPPSICSVIAPAEIWERLRACGLTEAPSDGRPGEQLFNDEAFPLWKMGYGETTWSRAAYAQVFARDGLTCRYCGSDCAADPTIDHVRPRCQGGGDGPDNLAVACRSCNSRKGGRTPAEAGMVLREVQ